MEGTSPNPTTSPQALADDPQAPDEVVNVEDAIDRSSNSITAPLNFIGGASGTQRVIRGWESGRVITRIRVHRASTRIQAYTIWMSGENGVTYGTPGNSAFSEYTFATGERITSLSLWGDGMGTRAGYIEFTTSRGNTFAYGMDANRRRARYPTDVGSGICVGAIFNVGDDIHAHGFYFLSEIENTEVTNVTYPGLEFQTAGIVPFSLRSFNHPPNTTNRPVNWRFSDKVSHGVSSSWSLTTGLSVHASVTVTAGVPLVKEVQTEYGWEVSSSNTRERSSTSSKTFSWNISGVVDPGDGGVRLAATTRRGSLNIPYQGTMVVRLLNGRSFSYPISGWYTGVDYADIYITDQ